MPLQENQVSMYVCGPTVYNFIHIGNARPYVVFDTVRRFFEYMGYSVRFVQNFTDVDDKIIKRAIEESRTSEEVADTYIAEAIKDAEGLNVAPSTVNPRVTQEIPHIVEMIQTLIDKGFAYEHNGSVFFSTDAFAPYGKLSKKNLDELSMGIRIDVDENKKSPQDFILWKPYKEGEPKWPSPWGLGRPGWHIECSVMAKRYLGDTIDIHAGGEDLIFPHHENEIAQSEAANGVPFAKYWLHNGFINVDNRKMSKSLGNFFTLREIVEEFDYEVVRFFILNGHYRSPLNFSRELLESAKSSLERIKTCVFNINFLLPGLQDSPSDEAMAQQEIQLLAECEKYKEEFIEAMCDDFNTALALGAIFEIVRLANKSVTQGSSKSFAAKVLAIIDELCGTLGIITAQTKKSNGLTPEEIEALIEERQAARKNKDFKTADRIRNELNEKGIILEDTPQGVRYSYKA